MLRIVFSTAVIFVTSLIQLSFGQHQCYSATVTTAKNPSPNLPPDARLITCSEFYGYFCEKTFAEVNTSTYKDGSLFSTSKVYQITWDCAYSNDETYDSDEVEVTTGGRVDAGIIRTDTISYTKTCYCKTNKCNGEGYNSKCASRLPFTHNCYGYSGSKNAYSNKISVGCTKDQNCYQLAAATSPELHTGGCMNIKPCGTSIREGVLGTSNYTKICTCCSDYCNKKEISASDSKCPSTASTSQLGIVCFVFSLLLAMFLVA